MTKIIVMQQNYIICTCFSPLEVSYNRCFLYQFFQTYLDNMMKEVKDYKTLAVYSANIYTILQKLIRVHHLYNFPVHAFMSVFDETLTQSHATKAAASNVLARAEEMKTSFTGIMFKQISMSIFLGMIFYIKMSFFCMLQLNNLIRAVTLA